MATPSRSDLQLRPAVRERVPLLIGIYGPSGSGKTYSALRLAAGIQSAVGGEIGVVDTEARRALWYADGFKFQHLDFHAPFGPLDYLAAIRAAHDAGCTTIVVDSMSHEHEGPGGVLEMHTAEEERLAGAWKTSRDRVTFAAWQKPKAERRALINALLQMSANLVFCFRAREKVKLNPKGKTQEEKVVQLGWMPVGGDEYVYEMTLNALLLPGSEGVPSWQSEEAGESSVIKLPRQFKHLFEKHHQLCEDDGEALARWALGGATATGTPAPTPAAAKHISEAQRKELAALATRAGLSPADVSTYLGKRGYRSSRDIPESDYDVVRAWVERGGTCPPAD